MGPLSVSEYERIEVECKRALGWTAEKIAQHCRIPLVRVDAVFMAQDALALVDTAIDMYVPNPGQKRHHFCRSGRHALTDDNVYQRPNGDRECTSCRNERKQLEQQEATRRNAEKTADRNAALAAVDGPRDALYEAAMAEVARIYSRPISRSA
jgi:hypothetical protein